MIRPSGTATDDAIVDGARHGGITNIPGAPGVKMESCRARRCSKDRDARGCCRSRLLQQPGNPGVPRGPQTLPKVAAEMALSVLAYNLTRVMNIVGTKPLMAAIVA
jgi:hypothetical protein